MPNLLDPKWSLFLKAVETGSVTRAAIALDLAPSVVSRHIASLEREAGARLFKRTGRGVALTELGQQVHPRIVALQQQAEQLADDIRTSGSTPVGDVRVGLLPSTVPVLAGPLHAEVRKRWPRVGLHLTEGSSAQLEEWLSQGRLDLALLLREEDTALPDETVLKRVSLCLIVPVRHPFASRKSIPFDEVAPLPLVLPSEPHPLRIRLAKLARQKGLTFTQVIEADSIRLQHEIVAHEGGYAITAGAIELRARRRLAAVRIVRPPMSRAIVLAAGKHKAHSRAVREVTQLLGDMAPELLKEDL